MSDLADDLDKASEARKTNIPVRTAPPGIAAPKLGLPGISQPNGVRPRPLAPLGGWDPFKV